jgi:3-hydroxyacyl-CoA dehydrogenase
MTMSKAAIIGAGLIGRAWAISFARAGFDVALFDQDGGAAERALGFVDSVLGDLHAYDLRSGNAPEAVG